MDSMPQNTYRQQAKPIGEALARFMKPGPSGLTQRYETASQICSLWTQLLPEVLAEHCRIVDLSQGTLTVEADSPSFLYEMRISSQQLIGFLRKGCPSAKIREIKVVLAK
jgi:predicted nucleic acid-binding Zn ribbon protein